MVQCAEVVLRPPPDDTPGAGTRRRAPASGAGGRRAARRRATQLAIRRAAFRLIEERGYDGTSTEEIARLAGVSARTFFNYFPSKEMLFLLPQPLAQIITESLRSRPESEDPAASLAAAAMDMVRAVNILAGTADEDLTLTGIRLLASEPSCRRILEERRAIAEQAAWAALAERGIPADDMATRAAVTSIVAVTLLALGLWADCGGQEPLPLIAAQCLLGLPGPSRLASAFTATAALASSQD